MTTDKQNIKLQKALSVDDITRMTFKPMVFTGRFYESFGCPQLGSIWTIWGNSYNGKTSCNMQISKHLAFNHKVLYNTFEEQKRKSYQDIILLHNMAEVKRTFHTLPGEPIEQMMIRLSKRNSADVFFIDSTQHSQLTIRQYNTLKNEFPHKTKMFVSHAKGNEPKGGVTEFIRYDSDVKVPIKGFRAFPEVRGFDAKPFDIYPEKSKIYYQEL